MKKFEPRKRHAFQHVYLFIKALLWNLRPQRCFCKCPTFPRIYTFTQFTSMVGCVPPLGEKKKTAYMNTHQKNTGMLHDAKCLFSTQIPNPCQNYLPSFWPILFGTKMDPSHHFPPKIHLFLPALGESLHALHVFHLRLATAEAATLGVLRVLVAVHLFAVLAVTVQWRNGCSEKSS